MTKQDFIQYLSHPEKLNGHSIDALEKLVQEYPYFQMGRMLYLKNLHNENSIAYEKNLHITSAYAPSGKVLYNLIKKRVSKEEVGSVQMAVGKEQPIIKESQPTAKEILPKLETIVILQEMLIAGKEETPASPIKAKDDDMQLLEKQMLREAYRVSMTVDLLEKSDKEPQAKEKVTPTQISQHHSFNDWMKVVSGKTPGSIKEEPSTALKETKRAKSNIIDNFILEETAKSTPKSKVEFYSAENMAKKSIQDDENFVSETLAKIYLKQGNLPKALRSYEILLVKHPEKIHIFAPLLEKIKKLIKQQSPSRPSRREGGE